MYTPYIHLWNLLNVDNLSRTDAAYLMGVGYWDIHRAVLSDKYKFVAMMMS